MKKGITLIELLAVIAIISILFILMIPMISNTIQKAKETGIMTDFRTYETMFTPMLLVSEDERKNFLDVNKHLDKEMQLTEHGDEKEKIHVGKYIYTQVSENVLRIITKKKNGEEYGMLMMNRGGEVQTITYGFNVNKESSLLEEKRTNDGLEYIEKSDKEVIITGYTGEEKKLNIPPEIGGKIVTEIGSHAFSNNDICGRNRGTILKELTLPNTIKIIRESAFEFNDIKNVNMPNSVEEIEGWAFHNSNIEGVTFSERLIKIGDGAFSLNKIQEITLPQTLEEVGYVAFYWNLGMHITLSDKIKYCEERYSLKCESSDKTNAFEWIESVNLIE